MIALVAGLVFVIPSGAADVHIGTHGYIPFSGSSYLTAGIGLSGWRMGTRNLRGFPIF